MTHEEAHKFLANKKEISAEDILNIKVEHLPKTWEEFCENNPIKEGEVAITTWGTMLQLKPNRKRISNIDSFMKDKIEVEKTISSNCQVLLRFKSPKKEEIIELIKACVDKYEIIEDNDELAIMVYADSEYEINNILCLIKDKGYCKESRKILKIS